MTRFKNIKKLIDNAKRGITQDPEYSAVNFRKALEQQVKEIYASKINMDISKMSLDDLLSTKEFQAITPKPILDKMFFVKKIGNQAAHSISSMNIDNVSRSLDEIDDIWNWFILNINGASNFQKLNPKEFDKQAELTAKQERWERDRKITAGVSNIPKLNADLSGLNAIELNKQAELTSRQQKEARDRKIAETLPRLPDMIPLELREQAALEARQEREERAKRLERSNEAQRNAKQGSGQDLAWVAKQWAKKRTELVAKQEAEQTAKYEAEQRAKHEAEQTAKYEAEQRAKHEAEQKTKQRNNIKYGIVLLLIILLLIITPYINIV